jgi:hypothetical protein
MNYCKRAIIILVAVIVLLGLSDASAQWVFVARKALGKIERMTQPRTGDTPGYDVATVVIEGKADKVYSTAVKTIDAKSKFHITRQDPRERIIDFSDGTHSAGLKVSQVNDNVVHLLVVAVVPDQDSTTSLVLSGVMRVCKEVGANCSVEK